MKMEEAARAAALIRDLQHLRSGRRIHRPFARRLEISTNGGLYSQEIKSNLSAIEDELNEILDVLFEAELSKIEKAAVAELKALGITVEE